MDKKVLGRGLEALIPQKEKIKEAFMKEIDTTQDQSRVINLPLEKIIPNKRQPREDFSTEKLEELIASMKEKGVIQPVLVRPHGESFELIAGERRLRAAKHLHLKEMPAIIKNVDDKDALELALIENLQRDNLNPIEEAHAYQRLIKEFNFTQDQVAQAVGKARVSVANTMRLLQLPKEVQEAMRKEFISMAHARTLLSVDDAKVQVQLCNLIVSEGLSVREVENLVRKKGELPKIISKKRVKSVKAKDPHIKAIEDELQQILGTRVHVLHSQKRGKLQIEYYSLTDLDRLLGLMRKLKS